MQEHLIPLTDREKREAHQKGPKPYAVSPSHSGPAQLVIPDWYADPPPTQEEIADQAARRDQALLDWQEAGRRYTEQHPPPPVKWSNWPEAKEYDQFRREALQPYAQALSEARELYARMNCLQSMAERPPPPGSPSAIALQELKERLSQRPTPLPPAAATDQVEEDPHPAE